MDQLAPQYLITPPVQVPGWLNWIVALTLFAGPANADEIGSPIRYPFEATVSGDIAVPEGSGPFPAVVLMHGCGGLSPGVRAGMDQHARFLNDNGFATVILDSFTARGKNGGMVCESLIELGKARNYRQYIALNTLRFLQANPKIDPDNIFMMGQSNGGSVALGLTTGLIAGDYTEKRNFRAMVAYYPWCGALKLKIQVPLLVLGAAEDEWVSPARCVEVSDQIKGASFKVIVYDGAHHSFDLPIPLQIYVGFKVGGNEAAADKSRAEMLAWFRSHMFNPE